MREMTSTAYTVGLNSIAEMLAEGSQVSTFIATTARTVVLPDEESRTRHPRPRWVSMDFEGVRSGPLGLRFRASLCLFLKKRVEGGSRIRRTARALFHLRPR